jgi:hypothetical protein
MTMSIVINIWDIDKLVLNVREVCVTERLIVSWLTSSDAYFTYIQDEFIDWLIVSWLTFSDTYFTYIQDEFIDWTWSMCHWTLTN